MNIPSAIESNVVHSSLVARMTDNPLLTIEEIFLIARQNLFILLGIPLIFAIYGSYSAMIQTPRFMASTLVQLDPRPTKPISGGAEIYDPGYNSLGYYLTQLEIIRSRKLAAALVARLNLTEVSEYRGSLVLPPKRWEIWLDLLPGMPDAPPPKELSESEVLENTIRRTRSAISANMAPNTTLLRIRFNSKDPELAAQGANALADLYIEELLQARLDIYSKANLWIADKLNNVGNDLRGAEVNLQSYRESRKLLNVGGNRGLAEDELRESTKQLRLVERERLTLQNRFNEIQRLLSNPAAAPDAQALLEDPLVNSAARTYLAEKANVTTVEQRYGRRHPQYLSAEAKAEEAERGYLEQLRIKARGTESKLDIVRKNEQQLRQQAGAVRARLQHLDRDEFELSMLERDVRSNKQLYEVFLARFNETETSSSFRESNARIADPAVPPNEAFAPDKRRIVLIYTSIGLLLAVMLVLLRQLLHTRLETPDEIEALSSIPLIGILPQCRDRMLKASAVRFLEKQPKAAFSDAVRSVKTALLMAKSSHTQQTGGFVLAVTSAEPSEGKTTLCAALSQTLSTNSKVIVIDADMRRPTLARHFGRHTSKLDGLSGYLVNSENAGNPIYRDESSGIDFVPAGKSTHNPALLLESEQFGAYISDIRKVYDFVLIDTPPVLAASDALHLTKNVDGYLLVARAEKTHKKAFIGALKRLETVNAKCIGIVLNGTAIKRGAYNGYYYYGSNYNY